MLFYYLLDQLSVYSKLIYYFINVIELYIVYKCNRINQNNTLVDTMSTDQSVTKQTLIRTHSFPEQKASTSHVSSYSSTAGII